MAETIKGIQDAGVIATAKHYIGNEQEHNRDLSGDALAYSANIADQAMHELYLWQVPTLAGAWQNTNLYEGHSQMRFAQVWVQ
jgi:hypothetical protein